MWQYRQSSRTDDTLAHFGILGMHWGVRRFQNEDGTLTEEGKKRYQRSESGSEKSEEKSENSSSKSAKEEPTKKEKETRRLVDQAIQYYKDSEKSYLEEIENDKQNVKDLQKRGPYSAEEYLYRNFGNDWKDFKYIKDIWEIDDPMSWAKEESEKEYRYQLERSTKAQKESREEAKRCAEIAKKWGHVDINKLTKAELKELQELDKNLRWWGWADEHLHLS